MSRFFRSVFGWAVIGCLLLAGWALVAGGLFDSQLAREIRTSSTWIAPSFGIDEADAEAVIGNRRLVVVMLDGTEGKRGSDICDEVDPAADGTLVLVLIGGKEIFDHYGCSLIGDSDEIGKAAVAESVIAGGVAGFVDRPLEALKVAAVNYDELVQAGVMPDGARTISPSFPKYLIALAAVAAVLLGTLAVYVTSRRLGALASARSAAGSAGDDARTALSARMAVIARRIVDHDRESLRAGWQSRTRPGTARRSTGSADAGQTVEDFRSIAGDYADLMALIADADADSDDPDDPEFAVLLELAEELDVRSRKLDDEPDQPARSGRASRRRKRKLRRRSGG